jgi:hypothetical protein
LHEVIITEQNDAGSPIKTANPTKGGKLSEDTAPVLSILQKLVDIKQKNAETTPANAASASKNAPTAPSKQKKAKPPESQLPAATDAEPASPNAPLML